MTAYLIPSIKRPFAIEITLPGSKSIALRQLAMAALTEGTTEITGVPVCDDAEAMLDCLRALGVTVAPMDYDQRTLKLTGPMDLTSEVKLHARMSGASTRLLIGLAACRSGVTHIDGHASLRVRTNQPLYDVLTAHGCTVESQGPGLPVTIQGAMRANRLTVDGSISSQYLTALLTAAPFLAPKGLTVQVSGELVSRPYIEITLNEMRKRGVEASWLSDTELSVAPGQYQPGAVTVEGDATAATYFLGLATLHNSEVVLTNLGNSTHQGDYEFARIMETLGARVEREANKTVIRGNAVLKPMPEIDMATMPDAALTLIGMAPLLPGDTRITGLSTLHHKECDRLECPAQELRAWGLTVETGPESIVVPAREAGTPTGQHVLNTYHDHRMAMAFSLLGSGVAEDTALIIDDAAVVDKTYPHYWQDYERALG